MPDTDDLRRHYASLSDEALLELDPVDLTEIARRCFAEELTRRRLTRYGTAAPGGDASVDGHGGEPDWLEDAACVCAFDGGPGQQPTEQLEQAENILASANISYFVHATQEEISARSPQPRYRFELMVPAALNLRAVSLLDQHLFNPELAAEWVTHFEMLTDEELSALDLDDLTAGLLDRVERLSKAYEDEREKRGL
jgi:hypothetical protein